QSAAAAGARLPGPTSAPGCHRRGLARLLLVRCSADYCSATSHFFLSDGKGMARQQSILPDDHQMLLLMNAIFDDEGPAHPSTQSQFKVAEPKKRVAPVQGVVRQLLLDRCQGVGKLGQTVESSGGILLCFQLVTDLFGTRNAVPPRRTGRHH